jgi:poly(3-hydroxyalkanoate) depolymerase
VIGRRSLRVVHRTGAPGRVPLVLCNGIGSSLELFEPFVEALDPERPVVRFDVPGIGGSPAPRLPYRYPTLARSLRAAVEDLGYRGADSRVDILGISWGGGLAQQYAFQYPRHCRRQVLVATGTGMTMVPASPATLVRMISPRRHRDAGYARSVAGTLYGGSARTDPDATIAALHRSPSRTAVLPYLHQLQAITGWASLPFLPMIRQPTLVLAGDDDPVIPSVNATIMAALLPHGELHRYRGGHLELLTAPSVLAPVVEEFLDR